MRGDPKFPTGESGENELEARLAPEKIALSREDILRETERLERSGQLEKELAFLPKADVAIDAATLPDEKHTENQDAIFTTVDRESGFFSAGVLDGVGGQRGGALASRELKKALMAELSNVGGGGGEPPSETEVLKAIQEALEDFRARLDAMGPDFEDANTTISVVFGFPRGGMIRCFAINSGDSPIYMKKDSHFRKISVDDSLVETFRKFDDLSGGQLSDLEAKVHPQKNIILASARKPDHETEEANAQFGISGFPCHVGKFDLAPGDEILIASDGFTDQFREDEKCNEIADMVARGDSATEIVAASRLRAAQSIEGLSKNDDISVVKIKIAKTEKDEVATRKITQIFDAIQGDKHLASILAESLLGNFTLRGTLAARDVGEFYRQFPTLEDFHAKFKIADFLDAIRRDNGFDKYMEYQDAAVKFVELMYPKA